MMKKMLITLFLLIYSVSFFTFCRNSDDIIEDDLLESGQVAYSQAQSLIQNANVSEAFLFFTDPHLLSGENEFTHTTKNNLNTSFLLAKDLYDKLSLDFCLCGGDWLNQRDTQEMAQEKLLYADHLMKATFGRYYKMMGNHDTNYLGYVSINDKKRGDLPRSIIDNVYYSETGSAYYSFMGNETRFYILDSGLDWDISMDEYRWEQLIWLAKQLQLNSSEHNVIGLHMFYRDNEITPMSEHLLQICEAFNAKQGIKIRELDFDYAGTKGKIHLILSGHNHTDSLTYDGEGHGIPVIQTCNYVINGKQTFDLCLMDYDQMIMMMIRVGQGENRRVKLH